MSKRWLKIIAVLTAILIPVFVYAYSIDDIIGQINSLKNQIQKIGTNVQTRTFQFFSGFDQDLYYGIRNSDQVRKLQQLLIRSRYLDDGLDTGNYFSKTVQAVKAFQKDYQIPQTGYFGPLTRAAANDELVWFKSQEYVNNVVARKAAVNDQLGTTEYKILPKPKYDLNAIEKTIFGQINEERTKAGLKPLVWDEKLTIAARSHSQDQAGDNLNTTRSSLTCSYPIIRHEGFVNGFKVGDRIIHAGLDYTMAGENIVIYPLSKNLIYRTTVTPPKCMPFDLSEGPDNEPPDAAQKRIQEEIQNRLNALKILKSVMWVNIEWKDIASVAKEAVVDWMNSVGHKKNILTPEFEKTGVGVATVNDYIIVTQVFMTTATSTSFD